MELNKKQQENVKEDKKALKKYLIVMICALLCGGTVGILGLLAKGNGLFVKFAVPEQVIKMVGVYGCLVMAVLLGVTTYVLYRQGRTQFGCWDGENEEALQKIEGKLSVALLLISVMDTAILFFLGYGFYVSMIMGHENFWAELSFSKETNKSALEVIDFIYFVIVWGSAILTMVVKNVLMQKIVNLTKEINPEKTGSIYDPKFDKKWMAGCDEAERFVVYKSAYKSYCTMNFACSIASTVAFLTMIFFGTGVFPMMLTLVLWLVLKTSYALQTMYYEKHPSEVMK